MERAGHATGVVLGLALVVAAVAAAGAVGGVGSAPQVAVDADSVQLRAAIGGDSDAEWRVVYRIRLDDENATEAFRRLREDVETDPSTYLDRFRSRMERTVASAENATGRAMRVENVSVTAELEAQPQVNYGVVTYRLTWRNFAAVDGDRLSAGDALDRLFLDAKTSLEFTWPEGYALQSRTPEPTRAEAGRIVWQGRRDFDAGEPRVTLAPAGTGTPTDATPTAGGPSSGGSPLVPLALAALAALALGVGAWLYTRRDGTPAPASEPDDSGGSAGAATDDEGPPPDLLSNEERVLRLLDENGGRMKQKAVAEELDWTAAKTSQVVGDLRDEGEVDSFRLGRENVLTLPEVDIEPEESDGDDER